MCVWKEEAGECALVPGLQNSLPHSGLAIWKEQEGRNVPDQTQWLAKRKKQQDAGGEKCMYVSRPR